MGLIFFPLLNNSDEKPKSFENVENSGDKETILKS